MRDEGSGRAKMRARDRILRRAVLPHIVLRELLEWRVRACAENTAGRPHSQLLELVL
jgi:hypothetical protein